jgi:DNA-binding MarR family transcriptional regulator
MKDKDQKDFWEVDERFLKLLYSMIDEQALAAMGPTCFAVLCVIRRYVPYSGVSSFPSAQLIAKHLGISKPPVYTAIKKLAALNWLTIEKEGRKNVYGLNEKYFGKREDEWGDKKEEVAVVPYGIRALQEVKPALEEWKQTGKPPPGSPILIENANISVEINNFYDGAKQVRQEIHIKTDEKALDQIQNPTYRDRARKMMELAAERATQEALNKTANEKEGKPSIDK